LDETLLADHGLELITVTLGMVDLARMIAPIPAYEVGSPLLGP
jgi:hypothetical protein